MRYHIFGQSDSYPIALLVKTSAFNKQELLQHYVTPLQNKGVTPDDIVATPLAYNSKGQAPVSLIKEYLSTLLPELQGLGVSTLYVCDGAYFKVLTKQRKAEPHYGYVLPCQLPGYEQMQVVLGLNYKVLLYNPDQQTKLNLTLDTLASHAQGNYQCLGDGIIHHAEYPREPREIAEAINKLHQYPTLACDIEGFSLRFNEAGIGTIGFAWSEHEGIAFPVDYHTEYLNDDYQVSVGNRRRNGLVHNSLKEFFETYQGNIVWHGSTYDLKVLIYNLWMMHPLHNEGLLTGLEVMTRNFHDTKIIAYLATNSTAGNSLGLKSLAHEFAGNWAQEDIKDIRQIPLAKLLQYNLIDCLSTFWVAKKYYPKLVEDNQEELYYSLMLPSLKTIIQMELTGMPLSAERVQQVRKELETLRYKHESVLVNSSLIKMLNFLLQESAWETDYKTRQSKAKNPHKIQPKDKDAFSHLTFNPNSGPQLQRLLYEQMGLPVLDTTKKGQPATGADNLKKLLNHTDEPLHQEILEALIGYNRVEKILSTFLPAFEKGLYKSDGRSYLHGCFNLGGTVSGRLSSSDPNLQNLPANSTYGKLIKSCFQAPKGWIFCGADFSSLEDRINALLTRDAAKLRVYTDGYDGHSLRAFAYFREQMPDIEETVESINSIDKKYKHLRQDSKGPTFALTYQGTWMTLVKNLGWSEEKAKSIEARYHELYAQSTKWVKDRIQKAAEQGYSEAAFGLRIRTPLLHQTLLGHRTTPKEAEAEARTLGNAISGQSYGLLTNRALNAFMERVWASPYRNAIKPISVIHDAIYLLVQDDVNVIEWVNRELIEAMQWQELPEIQHDEVKLGAELDLFYPSWAEAITLPNNATQEEIRELCRNQLKEAA